MTETLVEKQIRLVLEQQCADLFHRLYRGISPDEAHMLLTVVVFDYGEENAGGNVAFKTSLSQIDLVRTFELLLDSWHGVQCRRPAPGITNAALNGWAREAKETLPAGVGFALVIGQGDTSAYVSSAERPDMIRMIDRELLPKWTRGERGQVAES